MLLAVVCCGGCATILGGIIGHQSGEAVAGAAIGAAVDFGDDVVKAVGIMLAGKKVTVYQEIGYINVNKDAIKSCKLVNKLSNKFATVNWVWSEPQPPTKVKGLKRSIYHCKTAEGNNFLLEFEDEKGKDLRIYIKPENQSTELRSLITSQISLWIKEIVEGK